MWNATQFSALQPFFGSSPPRVCRLRKATCSGLSAASTESFDSRRDMCSSPRAGRGATRALAEAARASLRARVDMSDARAKNAELHFVRCSLLPPVVWGPGIAVLWSCQRIDVCDSVRLLYLLTYTYVACCRVSRDQTSRGLVRATAHGSLKCQESSIRSPPNSAKNHFSKTQTQ